MATFWRSVAVVVLIICGVVLAASVDGVRGDDVVKVITTQTPVSIDINHALASFSTELSDVHGLYGPSPELVKQSYANLILNLRAFNPEEKGLVYRIGGNSADTSWYNADNAPWPPGVHYTVTPNDLMTYKRFGELTNTTFAIDTSMQQLMNASWAVAHVRAVGQYLGWDLVDSIELGNEPDLFAGNGLRSTNYTYADYVADFALYANNVSNEGNIVGPGRFVQGCTYCCDSHYLDSIGMYVLKFSAYLQTVSYHHYALSACQGGTISPSQLLSATSAAIFTPYYQWIRGNWSLATGRPESEAPPFRLGESNSVSCGGGNVSGTYTSTLWSVDYLLDVASINISSVNFHGGWSGLYQPITFSSLNGTVPIVKPLYYGMWLVSEVIGNGLPGVTYAIGDASFNSTNDLISVWYLTRTDNSTVSAAMAKVIIIHKDVDATSPANVSVSIPLLLNANCSSASVDVLETTSPSGVNATDGIVYAGRTFDGTVNGTYLGQYAPESMTQSSRGVFSWSVDPLTVAVLNLCT